MLTQVHVWQGTATRHTAYADWALLSEDEHARWRRLPPIAGAYYAGAHAAVRRILGRYLCAPPVALRLSSSAGGPVVHSPGDPLWFSLSHSGPHWMLALGAYPLGADIAQERPVDIEALQELALSGTERRTLAQHDKAERSELFFRCWTRKEAVFKAAGALSFSGLTNVDTHPEFGGEVVVHCAGRTGARSWRVRTVDAGEGRYAAVASPADVDGDLVCRTWPARIV